MEKFVGGMLLGIVILAITVGVLIPGDNDNFYMFSGLLLFTFAVWGGILLIKDTEK